MGNLPSNFNGFTSDGDPVYYMSERMRFKNRIFKLCDGNLSRYQIHDWDRYFDMGYREINAHEAFEEALRRG